MRTLLSDGTYTIQQFHPRDVDELYEAIDESRKELAPYLPWCHEDYSKADTRQWIAMQGSLWNDKPEYNFAVVDAKTGRLLGGVGLNRIIEIDRLANIGWWTRTSEIGRGVAVEAAKLATRFAFEDAGFIRIEISIHTENEKSIRVAEKLGAAREGVLRNRLFLHGKAHDAVLFSLIPEDMKRW